MRSTMQRATLTQEFRRLFAAPKDCVVQVVVPASPKVYFDIDPPAGDPVKGPGHNRPYKLAPFDGDQTIEIPLGRGQTLWGQSEEGVVHCGLIITEH